MKLSNRRSAGSVDKIELSMTAMIDVVFLLLIFFLVTTTFLRPERQVIVAIEPVGGANANSASDLQPVLIEMGNVGDRIMYRLGAIHTDRFSDLETALKQFPNKSDGAFLRVSDQIPFEDVAQVIGLCKSVGFAPVAYVPGD